MKLYRFLKSTFFSKSKNYTIKVLLALMISPLLVLSYSSTILAQALSQDQIQVLQEGLDFFNTSPSCTSSDSSGGGLSSGQSVYILGDSITLRSQTAYQSTFQQHSISTIVDGSQDRSIYGAGVDGNMLSGLDAITADKSDIQSSSAIVVALGTNDGDTVQGIDQVITALRTENASAPIYWVDTISAGRTASAGYDQQVIGPTNQAIYGQATPEKYQVISWFHLVDPAGNPQSPSGNEVDPNGYIDNSDGLGVHPTPAGISALTSLVVNTLVGSGAGSGACCSDSSSASTTTTTTTGNSSNLDYAGRPMLNAAQLQAISQNESVYQQAATLAGIPWEMLAAIHYEETRLSTTNPTDNTNGVYQILGTDYPEGQQLTPAEFQTESDSAATFIKTSAAPDNYPSDQVLTATTTDPTTIKDTFYSYNGRAYAAQAQQNGFNANTEGFEGSPYVMNTADAKRDVTALPQGETTWGQYTTSNTTLSYPADFGYGAFLIYSDIGGSSVIPSCGTNGPVAQRVVQLAEQQYQLWQSGQLKPGTGQYQKYTNGASQEWCGDFVSWIYNQASYPLQSGGGLVGYMPDYVPPDVQQSNGYNPSSLSNIESSGNFTWHAVDSGYTPQPGDIVVHTYSGVPALSHVNLVVGVSGTSITLIGGDEGNNNYTDNVVGENIDNGPGGWAGDGIVGFVSP